MRFTLSINCDNAAFDEYPGCLENEVCRRLKDGARKVGEHDEPYVKDINGNTVGEASFWDE